MDDSALFDDEDDDSSIGYYLSTGLLARVAGGFTLGLDVRAIGGTEVTLFGVEGDADSILTSLLIGYSWGDN